MTKPGVVHMRTEPAAVIQGVVWAFAVHYLMGSIADKLRSAVYSISNCRFKDCR